VLGLGALDFGLEQSIIIPALPVLAEHYDASLVAVAWLVTGFVLASIVAVPLFGRLGDLFGKRLMLLVSLAAFAIGSLICALTHSIELAIAGRIIQGLGAGVGPLTYGLARDNVSLELLPRAIGAIVGAAMAGGAIGFLLSGLVVDHFSAAALFWLLFILAGGLTIAVLVLVAESHVRANVRVDPGGAVFLAAGLVTLLLAISKGSDWAWSSARVVGLFVASAVLLTFFVLVERRVRQPLVDLALVVTRPFANANICVFAFGYSFFIAVFLVPQIAAAPETTEYGLGLSTMGIGLVLAPTGIVALAAGWAGGRIVDRIGPRALVALGSALGVAAYVSLTLAHGTAFELAAGSALVGVAWGFILTGIYSVVIRSASTDKTGVAIAVNVVIRNTAVAIGAQAAFAIVAAVALVGQFPAESGYTRAFVMGAAGAGLALLASALLPGRAVAPR
jgi:MFS family permease